MKKIFYSIFTFFVLSLGSVFACFNSDPSSNLINNSIPIVGNNGSILVIKFSGWSLIDDIMDMLEEADVFLGVSFPYTLNIAFSGFINDDGTPDVEVNRLILFYYSKNGEWTILRDVKNPSFTVVNDSAMALWGHHSIPSSLGYKKGNMILIVPYFATKQNESFDLSAFLANKKSILAAKNVNAPRIGLIVQDNRVAH
ncbi:MAG: hypothetical protein E7052_08415 [Lentisphaerae bacterium]|nr:hypothetical protein [Lentisphaerota bacterium]